MKHHFLLSSSKIAVGAAIGLGLMLAVNIPGFAAQQPNIVVIWGDDIG